MRRHVVYFCFGAYIYLDIVRAGLLPSYEVLPWHQASAALSF
jgi:hypothetical protein